MGMFGERKQRVMCKAFFFFACKLLHFKGPTPHPTLFLTDEPFFFVCATVDTINGALKSMTSTFQETFFNVILTM